MATSSRVKNIGKESRNETEIEETTPLDFRPNANPQSTKSQVFQVHQSEGSVLAFESQVRTQHALNEFDAIKKRAREFASFLKRHTSYLLESHPMRTMAGIAGVAFTVGILLRIARSKS